jgi:hypothetical protein
VTQLDKVSALCLLSLNGLAMGFPIYDFQISIGPIVLKLHGFKKMRSVNRVANGLLKSAVNGFTINSPGDKRRAFIDDLWIIFMAVGCSCLARKYCELLILA